MKKVIIIDYEGSNLFSVLRAFEHINLNVKVSNSVRELSEADAAILPGVGAYGAAMQRLNQLGLTEGIRTHIKNNKPFLGICLGMQLLFSSSEEFGPQQGISIFEGQVKKFPGQDCAGNKFRVPHMGWNQILKAGNNNWESGPLKNIKDGSFMYFVHSYYCQPEDKNIICSLTKYAGIEYCSSLQSGKVFAAQYHPEKSAEMGLKIYSEWAALSGLL